MRSALVFVLACPVLGCAPTAPITPIGSERPAVYDVHWLALTRDYQTAESYTGRTVRIRLKLAEYRMDGTEIKVWVNSRDVPPVLVFQLNRPVDAAGELYLEAVCRGPRRDGIHRTLRGIDFCVYCDSAVMVR